VYFATLQTGHDDIIVGLTLGIGKWWDDTALDERHWVFLTIKPSPANFNMKIEKPGGSCHFNFKPLGIALRRERHSKRFEKRVLLSLTMYRRRSSSELVPDGKEVNIRGRVCKH
jgi:hypothetical protein